MGGGYREFQIKKKNWIVLRILATELFEFPRGHSYKSHLFSLKSNDNFLYCRFGPRKGQQWVYKQEGAPPLLFTVQVRFWYCAQTGAVPKHVLCPNRYCAQTGTVSKQVLCLNKYCAQTGTMPKQVLCPNRYHRIAISKIYTQFWIRDAILNCVAHRRMFQLSGWVGEIERESRGLQPPAEPQAAFLNVIQLFSYFPFILSFHLQQYHSSMCNVIKRVSSR